MSDVYVRHIREQVSHGTEVNMPISRYGENEMRPPIGGLILGWEILDSNQ